MDFQDLIAPAVIAVIVLYIGWRRLGTRLNGEDQIDDLPRYTGPASLRERQDKADPYQAAADQANYRNYRG